MKYLISVLAVVMALVISTSTVSAQPVCGERSKFIDHLSDSYKETPTAIGLASNGNVIEVLTSDDGTWTIIVTRPDGESCVVATGESWEWLLKRVSGPTA